VQECLVLHSQNLAIGAAVLVVSMIAIPFVVFECFVPNSMSFAVLATGLSSAPYVMFAWTLKPLIE
jgi:hypothetical protein